MRKLFLSEKKPFFTTSSSFIMTCFLLFGVVSTAISQTCTGLTGIINTYAPVTNIAGSVVTRGTIAVGGSTTAFAVGDYVVIIQMTGIPQPNGGKIGKFELRKVTAVSGSNITLDAAPSSYDFSTAKVQIIRAPYCPTATVTDDIKPMAWNGTTGGVIALKGSTLNMNANIDASSVGFSKTYVPTTTVTTNTLGQGSTVGRGNGPVYGLYKGGGIGGGGGESQQPTVGSHGGGKGSGYGGVDGDARTFQTGGASSSAGGSGGGGGIIGGGGSGSSGGNGARPGVGGGVAGGAAGDFSSNTGGGGGGGTHSVGNGGNTNGTDSQSAAGGGSYGGGGGGAGAYLGGDDASGGGGGGSWTGGGTGGSRGTISYTNGFAGNAAITTQNITNTDYFLNTTTPRLMMGGGGGNSLCQNGGKGGGIVILEFSVVNGNSNKIIANGETPGKAPATCAGNDADDGIGAAGGGGGGQMMLNVRSFASTTTIEAKGGIGGEGNYKASSGGLWHGGNGGGGGGGGGVWVYQYGSDITNTGTQTVTIANTNITSIGAGAGSGTIVGGGASGPRSINPKNGVLTAQGGAGGNGLIATGPTLMWPLAPCTTPVVAAVTPKTQTVCAGNIPTAYTSTPSSGVIYTWFGPLTDTISSLGASISGQTSASYTPTGTALTTVGTKYYAVIINDINNVACSDTAFVQLIVAAKPNAGTDRTVCAGTNATLTGTNPTTGTWTAQAGNPTGGSVGSTSAGIATATFTNAAVGTYNFIYTAGGCTDTVTITVTAKPNASISGTTTTCNGGITTLTASGGGTYLWSSGETVAAITKTAGTYTVTVTNNGCTATANVTVTDNTTLITMTQIAPTCTGATANNNGKITLSSISNADKYGISTGATYTGVAYASATAIGTLPIDVQTAIPNAGDTYTVRFFNGSDACYKDTTITVAAVFCCPDAPSVSSPVMNICPFPTVDLITISAALTPSVSGGVFEWHVNNDSNSALVSNQTAVGAGTYYLFEKSPNDCYSAGVAVQVQIQACCPTPLCIQVTITRNN